MGAPWFRRPLRAAAAVACAAVALTASVWLLNTGRAPGVSADAAALAQVRRAVEQATQQGPFVFPGTENMKVTEAPTYRSEYVPRTDSLDAALSHLFDKYERGDASADEAYWLAAGYVAAGHLAQARDLATSMRLATADKKRFAILSAICAEQDGSIARAESLLLDIASQYPDDPSTAVNLAALYILLEKLDAARGILAGVHPASSEIALQARIEYLLEASQER